ncbi:hypothetical protein U0355_03505 [Salimicrobium sp. PL1-032A]|uniref:hypothetical protein n=1 Tax=Salimicrobium sp. PL1-032A TaxID=3095364 RepID=UPI0032606B44
MRKRKKVIYWPDKLAHLLDNTYIKGLVSHNLGYLYSLQNEHHKAIDYYISSMEYERQRNVNVNYLLNTILCIIIEKYNIGDSKECGTWIDEGLHLLCEHPHDYFREYYYHFHIYRYLIDPPGNDTLATFIEEEALPYFREKDHKDSIIKYAYILAQHFKKLYKYKQANHYYEVSLRTINNNHHLGGIIL